MNRLVRRPEVSREAQPPATILHHSGVCASLRGGSFAAWVGYLAPLMRAHSALSYPNPDGGNIQVALRLPRYWPEYCDSA